MDSVPLLQFDQVDFQCNGTRILQGIQWKIYPGEHWALLGPNGAGKTTLLQLACGYLWPSRGEILRQGQRRIHLGELRKKIGWISSNLISQIRPQEEVLHTIVSGHYAQIGFKYLPSTQPSAAIWEAAHVHLDQLDCGQYAKRQFGTLSQGEKQKVLIARARMAEPWLLFLDEPCAGMDPGARQRFLHGLNNLTSDPTSPTIVLVTHHVEEIFPSITHTFVLKEGRGIQQGPTDQVCDIPTLEAVYEAEIDRIEISGNRRWPIWK